MTGSWLEPERTDAWGWMRQLFVLAALVNWLPRGPHVLELYSSAGVVYPDGLARFVVFSPPTAVAIYAALLVGLAGLFVGRGGRWPAVVVGVASALLLWHEGVNYKAYDRLLLWHALAIAVAPTEREAVPGARWCVWIYTSGIYGLTGWSKILDEPAWWRGVPLVYDLVHLEFGMRPVGVWLSAHPALLVPMSWVTLLFEASFPLAVLVRRLQPLVLGVGVAFHLGTLVLMDVGSFWLVAPAAYPVLLHPSWVVAFQERLERSAGGAALVRWVLRFQG